MAFAYLIDTERRLVLTRAFGTVTDGDLLGHVRRLPKEPTFHSGMSQLADFRAATTIRVTAAGVRELGALNPFRAGARRAVIVASDYAYGMARMYQMIREPSEDDLEVFRDLAKALHWLRLDELETISARLSALH